MINSVKFLPYPVEREAANENNKFSNKILKIIDIVIYVVFTFKIIIKNAMKTMNFIH